MPPCASRWSNAHLSRSNLVLLQDLTRASPYVGRCPCAPQDILTELPQEGTGFGEKHWASVQVELYIPHPSPTSSFPLSNKSTPLFVTGGCSESMPTHRVTQESPPYQKPWLSLCSPQRSYQASRIHFTSETGSQSHQTGQRLPEAQKSGFLVSGCQRPRKEFGL